MNKQEREEFLAQYDLQEGDRVMMSHPDGTIFFRVAFSCPENPDSLISLHSVWRMVDGVPMEVKPKPKPDYTEHPLWNFFMTGSPYLYRKDCADWVQREIEAGRLK